MRKVLDPELLRRLVGELLDSDPCHRDAIGEILRVSRDFTSFKSRLRVSRDFTSFKSRLRVSRDEC